MDTQLSCSILCILIYQDLHCWAQEIDSTSKATKDSLANKNIRQSEPSLLQKHTSALTFRTPPSLFETISPKTKPHFSFHHQTTTTTLPFPHPHTMSLRVTIKALWAKLFSHRRRSSSNGRDETGVSGVPIVSHLARLLPTQQIPYPNVLPEWPAPLPPLGKRQQCSPAPIHLYTSAVRATLAPLETTRHR